MTDERTSPAPDPTTPSATGPATSTRRRWFRRSAVLVVILAAAVAGVRWPPRKPSEEDAVQCLKELGVILVRDASQRHVASVNLQTVKGRLNIDAAVSALAGLPYLTSLDAAHPDISDAAISELVGCKRIVSLNLSRSQITDNCLPWLTRLRRLEALYLNGTTVTSRAVPALAQLKHLKILDLSETNVAGNLSGLSRLPNLNWLLVSGLELADGSFTDLGGCGRLSKISIHGSTIDAAVLQQFRQQHPRIVVEGP